MNTRLLDLPNKKFNPTGPRKYSPKKSVKKYPWRYTILGRFCLFVMAQSVELRWTTVEALRAVPDIDICNYVISQMRIYVPWIWQVYENYTGNPLEDHIIYSRLYMMGYVRKKTSKSFNSERVVSNESPATTLNMINGFKKMGEILPHQIGKFSYKYVDKFMMSHDDYTKKKFKVVLND